MTRISTVRDEQQTNIEGMADDIRIASALGNKQEALAGGADAEILAFEIATFDDIHEIPSRLHGPDLTPGRAGRLAGDCRNRGYDGAGRLVASAGWHPNAIRRRAGMGRWWG